MDCYEEEGGDEMRKRLLCLLGILFAVSVIAGCQQKDPEPGEVAGYDEGEEYLSIWVHSIEDTEEGQAYSCLLYTSLAGQIPGKRSIAAWLGSENYFQYRIYK